jgi:hypothetical protein
LQGGDVKVQMTVPQYAEYAADCEARGKKEDAERKKELVDTVAAAVQAAFASLQGLPPITSANVHHRKAKKKKTKIDC